MAMVSRGMRGLIRRPVALLVLLVSCLLLSNQLPSAHAAAVAKDEVGSLLKEATASIEARRFQDAITALKRILELDPGNPDAHVQLGRAQANLGNLEAAEGLYLQALQHDPYYAPAMTALGKLYLYQVKLDEARRFFEAALARHSRDADALLGLARLEIKASVTQPEAVHRAEDYLRRSLELAPKNEQALFDYGIILSQLGRHDDAARSFSAAVVLNPTINFTLLGQFYSSYEQWPRAADSYRSALERDPADTAALMGSGTVNEMLGKRRDAMAKYHRLLEVDATHAQAHTRLGQLLLGTGLLNYGAQQACGLNRDEAMWHLHQAAKLDPTLQHANDSLEFCLREEVEERNWAERVAALKAAYQHVPPTRTPKAAGKKGVHAGPVKGSQAFEDEEEEEESPLPSFVNAGLASIPEALRQPVRRFVSRLKKRLHKGWRRLRTLAQGLFPSSSSKSCTSSGTGHGKASGEVWVNGKAMQSIPVAEVHTPEQLMRYVKQNQPVILKNFQQGFASRQQWMREALKRRFGHMPVRVSVSQTGRFDGPEDGALWGLGAGSEVLVRPPSMSMRFGDFVDLLQLAAAHPHSVSETFYLEYLSLAQYLGPEMLELIPMPRPAEQSGMEHLLTNFWMGKGNTTSPLHYDDYENLLCQLVGSKHLTLFPPSDIRYLYYTGRAKGLLEYEYPATFRRRKLADSKYAVVFGSSVFMEDPDMEKHPLLKHATPYKVVLEEGDVLYLPAFWHHEVRSEPDDVEQLNLAINYWFRNETAFAHEDEGLAAARDAAQRQKQKRRSQGQEL